MAPESGMMTEALSPAAPCVAWHSGNKDECNREEGDCCYPSHFYLTTTRNGRPQANRCQTSPSSGWLQDGREIKSVSASSGVTHRSNTTPHGHATVSR